MTSQGIAWLLRDLELPKGDVRKGPRRRASITQAFPKPSHIRCRREAVKIYRDGREVCTDTAAGWAEYHHRTAQMYERDKTICCICLKPIRFLDEATCEHKEKRGMGASTRDDRIEKNGVAHAWCNAELGSRRIERSLDMAPCMDCDSAECVCEGGAA
jgi:hypothetical protein